MQPSTFWFITTLMMSGSFTIHNNQLFTDKDEAESMFEQFNAGEGVASFNLHSVELSREGFGNSQIIRSRDVTY